MTEPSPRQPVAASRIVLRDVGSESGSPVVSPIVSPSGEPERSGRYRVLGEIARGGMGVVLKGHDEELGRDVAMKVLHAQLADRPEVVRRFVEEAQIGGQLQHPGIVPVYELGLDEKQRPWFTMKLVKGRTLSALLEERRDLAADRHRFIAVFESICLTLAYAHSRGVIHRDLKPANIMVGAFGEVQVVDWGLAKVLGQGGVADERRAVDARQSIIATVRTETVGSNSLAGSIFGTPAYMAPEQAQGFVEKLDERSDVFSLGAILCEILTGAPPYVGTGEEVLEQAMRADVASAQQRLEKCAADRDLIELAKECLLPAQAARPRNAAALASRVTAHLAALGQRAHAAELGAANARARGRGLMLAVCVLALLLLAGGGWWWVERRDATRRSLAAGRVASEIEIALARHATALAARPDDSAAWEEARAAAQSAATIAASLDVSADVRRRAAELEQSVALDALAATQSAERARRDRAMVDRLDAIRGTEANPDNTAGEDFEQAYRDYGIDVRALAVPEAAERVRTSDIAVPLALGLDDWSSFDKTMSERLSAIASAADPDPWRDRLRAAETLAEMRALAEAPDFGSIPKESRLALAYALRSRHDLPGAIAIAQPLEQAHPDDFGVQMALAIFLFESPPNRAEEAMRHVTAAVALRPGASKAWQIRGRLAADAGNSPDALVCFERAVEASPQDVLSRLNLAYALGDAGRWSDALVHTRAALARNPELAQARVVHGLVLINLGEVKSAAETLRLAVAQLARGPGGGSSALLVMARCHLALALWRGDDLDGAFAAAEAALAPDAGPRSAIARGVRGALLARRGDVAAGRAELDESLRLEPRNSEAWFDLGDLDLEQGAAAAAVASFRKAVELEPRSARVRRRLGKALLQSGAGDAAIDELAAATRLAPEDPRGFGDLGLAQRDLGRLRDAQATLEMCDALARSTPGTSLPSAQWLAEIRRLVALEPKLADLARDAASLDDAREALDAARLCAIKRRSAEAATLFERAFALQPALADDPATGDRFEAACQAVLAGSASRALAWLRDDFALLVDAVDTGNDAELATAARRLRGWLADPRLAAVRDPARLAQLETKSAAEWRDLWNDVGGALERSKQ